MAMTLSNYFVWDIPVREKRQKGRTYQHFIFCLMLKLTLLDCLTDPFLFLLIVDASYHLSSLNYY
jgi:uncharacterized protein YydD (DUF2326 family)